MHAERDGRPAYLTVGTIARGGMGTVELVVRREGSFERLYARKRPHDRFREDDSFRAAFLEEARLAGLLRHPHVVSVLDVGEDSEGPYLLMDFVEGLSLSAIVGHFRRTEGLLPLEVCLTIARQVAEGIHAAHELRDLSGEPQPLVHRDVSPQNILVEHAGVARVTDFGLAKALGGGGESSRETLKGKLGYMSPEQLRFIPLDRRSDLFSLGVVLYEMLTAQRLYLGDGLESTARMILHETPSDPGEVRDDLPPALLELLYDLLCRERDGRPDTGAEVSRRIAEVLRQLEGEEEPLELRDFMALHFGALRRKSEKERATAVRRALGGEAPIASPSAAPTLEPTIAARPSKIETREWSRSESSSPFGQLQPRVPRWPWVAAAAIVLAALAVSVMIVELTGSSRDAPPISTGLEAPERRVAPEEPSTPEPPSTEPVEPPEAAATELGPPVLEVPRRPTVGRPAPMAIPMDRPSDTRMGLRDQLWSFP
ncbi:MAG: serine/threonine-protein kinase [Myxococcota bacterium]